MRPVTGDFRGCQTLEELPDDAAAGVGQWEVPTGGRLEVGGQEAGGGKEVTDVLLSCLAAQSLVTTMTEAAPYLLAATSSSSDETI